MSRIEEFDFSIEAALRYFENVSSDGVVTYVGDSFGIPQPIQSMLKNIYKCEVIVTPRYIIFDKQFFYYTPLWICDFMYYVTEYSYNNCITTRWCAESLKELSNLWV